jgi:hypothetical protein
MDGQETQCTNGTIRWLPGTRRPAPGPKVLRLGPLMALAALVATGQAPNRATVA